MGLRTASGSSLPSTAFASQLAMNVADLLALPVHPETEKDIVGCLIVLLAAGAGTDVIETRSPWRMACCKEFLDAMAVAFLKRGMHKTRIAPPCATLIAEFLWRAPEVGQYEAAWRAHEAARAAWRAEEAARPRDRSLCRNLCREPVGICRFEVDHGRSCTFFHPPLQILKLAQQRALAQQRGADDLVAVVQAIYMEREAQGIPSPINPARLDSINILRRL